MMDAEAGDDRALMFKVRAPLGFFGHHVLDAFKAVAPGKVRGAQPQGYGYYEVAMFDLEGVRMVREAGVVEIGSHKVDFQYLGVKVRKVSVFRYPIDFPDTDLQSELERYGRVLKLTRERYTGEHSDCETGTRIAMMELVGELPNYITVRKVKVECLYYGVRRRCAKCNAEGHISRNCLSKKCRWCDSFYVKECEKCKRTREALSNRINPRDVVVPPWGGPLSSDDGWAPNVEEFPALTARLRLNEVRVEEAEKNMVCEQENDSEKEKNEGVEGDDIGRDDQGSHVTVERKEDERVAQEKGNGDENEEESEKDGNEVKEVVPETADDPACGSQQDDACHEARLTGSEEDSDSGSSTSLTLTTLSESLSDTVSEADSVEIAPELADKEGEDEERFATPKNSGIPRRVTRASMRKGQRGAPC